MHNRKIAPVMLPQRADNVVMRQMRTLRGTPKHLRLSGHKGGFTYLMITLPFRCNYRCPKCFNLSQNRPVHHGAPIPLSDLFKLIDEARELEGRAVVIAGEGEPTLDPNIRQLVAHTANLGLIPIVYSNGSTLTEDVALFYKDHSACLVIAVDSLNPSVYGTLTGTPSGMLPRVLKNLDSVRRVYAGTAEALGDVHVLRLAINMTICSLNITEIANLKALAGNDFYFICNPLAHQGNAIGNWARLVSDGGQPPKFGVLAAQNSESGGPLTLNSEGLCGYSIGGIGVGPYGDYMTCAYTTRSNGLLGTIRDQSLKEAFEYKVHRETDHYKQNGTSPCLVRASSFDGYLSELNDELNGPIEKQLIEKTVGFSSQLVSISGIKA